MTLKATDVQRLQRDETFKAIIEKVRSDQVATFVQSNKNDTELREEAHSILRALDKIEQVMKSVLTDEAIKMKRKEGRSK